jgi:hypothetical protein
LLQGFPYYPPETVITMHRQIYGAPPAEYRKEEGK